MPRINLKINIQTHVTAFAPVSLFGLNGTSLTASFFFLLSKRENFNQRKGLLFAKICFLISNFCSINFVLYFSYCSQET